MLAGAAGGGCRRPRLSRSIIPSGVTSFIHAASAAFARRFSSTPWRELGRDGGVVRRTLSASSSSAGSAAATAMREKRPALVDERGTCTSSVIVRFGDARVHLQRVFVVGAPPGARRSPARSRKVRRACVRPRPPRGPDSARICAASAFARAVEGVLEQSCAFRLGLGAARRRRGSSYLRCSMTSPAASEDGVRGDLGRMWVAASASSTRVVSWLRVPRAVLGRPRASNGPYVTAPHIDPSSSVRLVAEVVDLGFDPVHLGPAPRRCCWMGRCCRSNTARPTGARPKICVEHRGSGLRCG